MEIQNSHANNVILTQSELEASYKLRNKEIFDLAHKLHYT